MENSSFNARLTRVNVAIETFFINATVALYRGLRRIEYITDFILLTHFSSLIEFPLVK